MIEMPLALNPPDPAVKVRPVRLADVPVLHDICWPERPLTYANHLIKRARQIALQGRGLGVVVVGAGSDDLRAFGQLTMWPRGGEISDLVVGDAHRGKGIGTTVIQYLVQVAREMRADCVEIGVAHSNTGALALYRRLGFVDDHNVVINLGDGPEPVLYLRLDLPPRRSLPI